MINELGNIHAKWKLLIENTCMLLVNRNVTMWIGTWFGVCGRVTNKGGVKTGFSKGSASEPKPRAGSEGLASTV
jgi:hypothetical protein